MPIDHVLPSNLDDLYGPGADQADIDAMRLVSRDVTLRFYRHAKIKELGHSLRADEIIIVRNGIERLYKNPNNARYNRIAEIIKENDIPLDIDLRWYTEIQFQADKE